MIQVYACLLVQFDAEIPSAIRPLFPYASPLYVCPSLYI